jgi:hypothetical protein
MGTGWAKRKEWQAELIPRVPLTMAALEGLAVGWVLGFSSCRVVARQCLCWAGAGEARAG